MAYRLLRVLAVSAIAFTTPSWASEAYLERPDTSPKPAITVPVTTLPGNYIGCVIIPTPSLRALTGFKRVHAVACVEATTGEVIVAVLRKNGTLACSGSGYLDPNNTRCANVNVCGQVDYYCLF